MYLKDLWPYYLVVLIAVLAGVVVVIAIARQVFDGEDDEVEER